MFKEYPKWIAEKNVVVWTAEEESALKGEKQAKAPVEPVKEPEVKPTAVRRGRSRKE